MINFVIFLTILLLYTLIMNKKQRNWVKSSAAGFEPTRVSTWDFKSHALTNSAKLTY